MRKLSRSRSVRAAGSGPSPASLTTAPCPGISRRLPGAICTVVTPPDRAGL
jgi:hypothetical protein